MINVNWCLLGGLCLGLSPSFSVGTVGYDYITKVFQGQGGSVTGEFLPELVKPNQLVVDKIGRQAVVLTHNGSCFTFELMPNGEWQSGVSSRCASTVSNALALAPDGMLYVSDQYEDGSNVQVRAYSKNQEQEGWDFSLPDDITEVVGLSSVHSMQVTDDGKILLITSRRQEALLSFRRSLGTGKLELLDVWQAEGDNPIVALKGAGHFAVTPDSLWLAVSGFFANSVVLFRRKKDSLSWTYTGSIGGGLLQAPAGLSFSKDGQKLFVTSSNKRSLEQFCKFGGGWVYSDSYHLNAVPGNLWIFGDQLLVGLQGNTVLGSEAQLLLWTVKQGGLEPTGKFFKAWSGKMDRLSDATAAVITGNSLLLVDSISDRVYIHSVIEQPVLTDTTEVGPTLVVTTEEADTESTVPTPAGVNKEFYVVLGVMLFVPVVLVVTGLCIVLTRVRYKAE